MGNDPKPGPARLPGDQAGRPETEKKTEPYGAPSLEGVTVPHGPTSTPGSTPAVYLIEDALGRSLRARGLDSAIPLEMRDDVAEAAVMNGVRELGTSTVKQPAIEGALVTLALSLREGPSSHYKLAVAEALEKRSPALFKMVESLESDVLSKDELSILQSPELITARTASVIISKIENAPTADELKVVLLAPLVIYGDIDSGVRDNAGASLKRIDRTSFRALIGDYGKPPF